MLRKHDFVGIPTLGEDNHRFLLLENFTRYYLFPSVHESMEAHLLLHELFTRLRKCDPKPQGIYFQRRTGHEEWTWDQASPVRWCRPRERWVDFLIPNLLDPMWHVSLVKFELDLKSRELLPKIKTVLQHHDFSEHGPLDIEVIE